MKENSYQNRLEATISHRFVNLTPLLSQKNNRKNFIVEDIFWTAHAMIARCQYNFKAFDNPKAKNKYIEGVNKFKGADTIIHKIAYQ